jgi:hypothetical protein
MPIQQLFYQTVVPVSAQRHTGWSVKTGESYAFAAEVNSVPITAIEFAEAAAEYPIVFAGNENGVLPAVILGLRENENLSVTADGRWSGKYIPAFVRRYPFVFSQDAEGKVFTLNIDETFSGCNQANRGEHLFDADGNQTTYLRTVLGFLQDYQARFRRTQAYCARLQELGLLQPMQAQFTLPGGDQRSLSGFMAVDRAKLTALPGDVLADMVAKDELECTYLHLASLRHFNEMAQKLQAAPPPAPIPAPEPEPEMDEPTAVH